MTDRIPDGARGYDGFGGVVATRTSQSTPWWPAPRRARAGAPNVIVVLVDDMGFSDVSPFGGEIDTPAVHALADEGYRFANFHATPLCSPSRAALLTGANPHRAGFGMVAHADPGYPGYRMLLPRELPTLAESFRENGYATFMVGKWHLTLESLMHDGADRSSWPVQRGFDRYFGSMDGFTTLYHPHRLVRDNSVVAEDPGGEDYLTDRLTDEAIAMIDGLRANEASRPFFLYFAHHAVHGPVQAKPEDIAKYRGAYDAGWDRVRAERLERQIAAGLMPAGTVLPAAADSDDIPRWDELDDEARALFARHMEVYAAAVDGVDQSLGRLVAHLKEIDEYDNTIIVFTSDNGGTAEGGPTGTRSYFSQFVHAADLPRDWVRDVERPLDEMGGPRVHGHYPAGWARVSNTPFRQFKGSLYEGGIHTPLVVSWPAGLPRAVGDDGVRTGFAYITDLAPTLLELAGATRAAEAAGVRAEDADGESFAAALRDSGAPGRADQYLALVGQRAYFGRGFKAVAPALGQTDDDLRDWRLYDLAADPAESMDVAAEHPDIVADLAERWRVAAWRNTVFPLGDDFSLFGVRPATDLEYSQPVTIRPGTPTLERWRSARLVSLRSFVVEVDLDGDLGEGMLFSHGDQGGGYALYAEAGALVFAYNAYGRMTRSAVETAAARRVVVRFAALAAFEREVVVEVDEDERMRLDRLPMLIGMAPFTGISVGADGGGPVDWELFERHGRFPYSGDLRSVRYVPGATAPYNHEVMVAVDEISARLMD
ncbi:MAG: arylsulfatase [Microbacterium sp.]|uniref:arylsulfatase n=1 Tax=Microbacterium sp. TaxID=51671 RepID=UPI001AD3DA90|nr:arylsulfatase [Microbacterium sp.]MBN9178673.1 arylsulfatase [Microbacterium sp.]